MPNLPDYPDYIGTASLLDAQLRRALASMDANTMALAVAIIGRLDELDRRFDRKQAEE